jgi:hypothetical protein
MPKQTFESAAQARVVAFHNVAQRDVSFPRHRLWALPDNINTARRPISSAGL